MLPARVLLRGVPKTACRQLSTAPVRKIQENVEGNESSDENYGSILKNKDFFKVHNLFTVKEMFEAKVHYGHKEVSLHDGMKPFVFGSRLGHIILDLDIAAHHLRRALNFCAHVAYRDGIILFISHNKRCSLIVEKTAEECKEFAYVRDWRAGTFLESSKVFSIETRLPDLCIFLNTQYETGQMHRAVIEASRLLIPTIGIVDSNCNPNLICYPVPGNDDSPSSVSFFCRTFKNAILRGKNQRNEEKKVLESS